MRNQSEANTNVSDPRPLMPREMSDLALVREWEHLRSLTPQTHADADRFASEQLDIETELDARDHSESDTRFYADALRTLFSNVSNDHDSCMRCSESLQDHTLEDVVRCIRVQLDREWDEAQRKHNNEVSAQHECQRDTVSPNSTVAKMLDSRR